MTTLSDDLADVHPARQRVSMALAVGITVPAIAVRIIDPSLPHAMGALIFGLAIVVLGATRVDPNYWYLGMSFYLRAGAILTQPVWQPRAAAIDWHSIRTKIAAALVTAATLPLFAFVVLELYGAPDRDALPLAARQATFGVISLVLLAAYAIAWSWGAAISRAHRRVAAAVPESPADG